MDRGTWQAEVHWVTKNQKQLKYWSGLPCSPPGDLPDPGIEPLSLLSPALAGGFLTASTLWEALLAQLGGI